MSTNIAELLPMIEERCRERDNISGTTPDGRPYVRGKITPLAPPQPEPLSVTTIESLAAACESTPEIQLVVVESPTKIVCYGALDLLWKTRPELVVLSQRIDPFPWGQYLDQESFVTLLQARFNSSGDRDGVQTQAASALKAMTSKADDDGVVSQTIEVKQGITLVRGEKLRNPVGLSPIRTIFGIPSPLSLFVFRARESRGGGVEFALFEADGGEWQTTAISETGAWLRERLTEKRSALLILS